MPSRLPGIARSSAFDDIGDREAPPGSRPWCRYYAFQAKKIRDEMNMEVEQLRRVIGYLEEHRAWQVLGYPSLGMMLYQECNLSDEDLEAVKIARPGETVGAVLGPHGGDRRSEGAREDQADNVSLKFGNSADYLTARIARDHPDVLERMKAGEFPSVRAAAREAGIVRPTAMFYTDRPEDAARAILRHFDGDRLEALIRALAEQAGLDVVRRPS